MNSNCEEVEGYNFDWCEDCMLVLGSSERALCWFEWCFEQCWRE